LWSSNKLEALFRSYASEKLKFIAITEVLDMSMENHPVMHKNTM
jgi:hypothetical protein